MGQQGAAERLNERAVRACGDACPGYEWNHSSFRWQELSVDGRTETLMGFSVMLGIYSKDRWGIKGQEMIFGVTEKTRHLLRT